MRETNLVAYTIQGMKAGQLGLHSSLCKSDQGPNSTQTAPIRTVALFPEPVQQPALRETDATCGKRWALHPSLGLPPETTMSGCCSARSQDPIPGTALANARPRAPVTAFAPQNEPNVNMYQPTHWWASAHQVQPLHGLPLGFEPLVSLETSTDL